MQTVTEHLWHIISWVKTAAQHAYPVVHFTGTEIEVAERLRDSIFPKNLEIRQEIPKSY